MSPLCDCPSAEYYTYAYLREDGTPYYIGKGKGKRHIDSSHCVKVPPEERILFLKRDLSEQEAYKHEIYLIHVLGRKDLGTGCLRNLTHGGEGGGHNVPHSEEAKRKISESNKGKHSHQPRHSGQDAPWPQTPANTPGRVFSEEHRRKLSEARKGKKFPRRANSASAK
jgi:hypothetical protein